MKYLILLIVFLGCSVYLISSTDLARLPISGVDSSQNASSGGQEAGLASSGLELGGEASGEMDAFAFGDSEAAPKLVLMKFGAPWCPPCRMVDKELKKLERSSLPVEIKKIDVDEKPEMAARYKVSSIPRLILMQDGRKIGDLVGYQSADELSGWITEHASKEALAAKKRDAGPAVVKANPFFK